MKTVYRLFLVLVTFLFILATVPNPIIIEASSVNQFPDGTIVVPIGTHIRIDDNAGLVTIFDCPVDISEGDTFVVYLQDLPIGYNALSLIKEDDDIIISVEKTDKSIYSLLDEEGVIQLTPDMYEFIPAPNVAYMNVATASGVTIGGDGLEYQDGKLSMTISQGGAKATVYISNLSLSHSVSNGDIGLSLNGNWGIKTAISSSKDVLSDLPLGEIRIMGIGKIGINLSLAQSLSMKCNLSGTFSAGVTTTQDGEGTAYKDFTVTNKSVEGKGSITASMKITAGVDVLVAAADIYVEVGVDTQYTSKTTFHEKNNSVECDDFRIYIFSTVGVEAKYYSVLSGKMKPLASKTLLETDENSSPFYVVIHFENGKLVNGCSQGMVVPERHYGGFNASFSGTILSDNRKRIIETDVDLPWDMTIDQDLTILNGKLNLNGHTLTVEGDLIHEGGTLTIDNGTLIIHGDYRMQSKNNGTYDDSTGILNMNNSDGNVYIDGDFIVQTNSTAQKMEYGTINLKGDLYQNNTSDLNANFITGKGLNIVLTSEKSHLISFDDCKNNSIGWLTLDNDVLIKNSIEIGKIVNNGHNITIDGDFTSTQSIETNDPDSGGHSLTVNGNMFSSSDVNLSGDELIVTGTLYQYSGTMFIDGGKLSIADNYYLIGKDSTFEPGKENLTGSNGHLKMICHVDEVHVGGNFITKSSQDHGSSYLCAGTLYVAGNFTELIGNEANWNFQPAVEHKTVLNGTREQIVSFEDPRCGFGTFESSNEDLVFENYISWLLLESDINATSNSLNLDHREMDLNGKLLTINGDIILNTSININSGTMAVNGSLLHSAGTLDINGGKVNITGDYFIIGKDSTFETGKENIIGSNGYLKMVYSADELRVQGDFITRSTYDHGSNYLSAGTMYLGGNFTELIGNEANWNFQPAVGHKTVLNGTGKQVISFEDTRCGFGTLESTNENLVFENNISWLLLESDINATSNSLNLDHREMDLNGKALTIDGNIILNTTININNGTMTVNGSLLHSAGTLDINGGKVNITGDYYIIGKDSTFEPGKESITGSTGFLKMVYPADELRVQGDFITRSAYDHGSNYLGAGTLYVAGNFVELIGNEANWNFQPAKEHTTVLNGTGEQIVSFEDPRCGFGTFKSTNENLVFEKNISWLLLESDINATTNNLNLDHREMDLNGKALTIDGDIILNTVLNVNNGTMTVNGSLLHPAGTLYINGGNVNITGDYYIIGKDSTFEPGKENITGSNGYLKMVYPADELRVQGDFITRSAYDHGINYLGAGTLYIAGNFTELIGNEANWNFQPAVGHKTVLNGTGKQIVNFEDPRCGFGTLKSSNEDLVFENNVSWLLLDSDINVASNSLNLDHREMDLSGNSLTIDGNIILNTTININNGTMTVNGSLLHSAGTLDINGGKVNITGDYYIIGKYSTFEPGKENITGSNGYLKMVYPADELYIQGDFVTKSVYDHGISYLDAGTMYVEGNFTELIGNSSNWNFQPTVGHKTVLNGTGKQVVSFEDPKCGFGTLEITKPIDKYVFNPNPCWTALISPEESTSSEPDYTFFGTRN